MFVRCYMFVFIIWYFILYCFHISIFLFCDNTYMWSVWVEENLCRFLFIVCLYMYCHWRSRYEAGEVGILLTGLTLSHFCACTWISNVICRCAFFVFRQFRWEVAVRFVDIGVNVDHHCLNYLFNFEVLLTSY
jgi:hypothetical protein